MSEPDTDSTASLVSDPEWLERILRELGTRDVFETLAWRLPDGFDVPAVRGPQDVSPGRAPIAMRPGGVPWIVREDVDETDDQSLSAAFGADCTGLVMGEDPGSDVDRMVQIVADAPLIRHLVAGSRGTGLVEALVAADALPRNGTLDLDPGFDGPERRSSSGRFDWVKSVLPSANSVDFRPACANGLAAHRRGATDATELAVVLASTASWLRELIVERGVSPDDAAAAIHVVSSARPLFFPTLARHRAIRLCVHRVASSFGVSDAAIRRIPVHAQTSPRIQSVFDPWTNLLRATTAASAAVMGGCDSLTVTPHDAQNARSRQGRRLALSLQALLRDEGRLHLVSDPACGSWYIETLTDRMAETGWRRFQQIEQEGGLAEASRIGGLSRLIRAEGREEEEAIDRRASIMVGVNRYADPSEAPPPSALSLDPNRPSGRIESLRAAMHPEMGHGHAHPPALLLAFGERRDCGPRSSFVSDFLGCAGIRVEGPVRVETEDAMTAAVRTSESPIIVLCGSDEAFRRYGQAARRGLADRHGGATLVGVGRPPEGEPGNWAVDSCIDQSTPLVAGLGRILSAAGLRFESER